MKFGKTIQEEHSFVTMQWEYYFLRYKDLKKEIKKLVEARYHPDKRFFERYKEQWFEAITREAQKVEAFYLAKGKELKKEHSEITFQGQQMLAGQMHLVFIQKPLLKRRLVKSYANLKLLQRFSAINCEGFRKLVKKLDKNIGTQVQKPYMVELKKRFHFAGLYNPDLCLEKMMAEATTLYTALSSKTKDAVIKKFEDFHLYLQEEQDQVAPISENSEKKQEVEKSTARQRHASDPELERKAEETRYHRREKYQKAARNPLVAISGKRELPPLIARPGEGYEKMPPVKDNEDQVANDFEKLDVKEDSEREKGEKKDKKKKKEKKKVEESESDSDSDYDDLKAKEKEKEEKEKEKQKTEKKHRKKKKRGSVVKEEDILASDATDSHDDGAQQEKPKPRSARKKAGKPKSEEEQ